MQADLIERLQILAKAPLLLVACDYDGTLAPLVIDRAHAFPDMAALRAFQSLSVLPWTTTAVISGRSIATLRELLGPDCPEVVAGSHGAEWFTPGVALTADQASLRQDIGRTLRSIAAGGAGLDVEIKPASAALHYRGATDAAAQDAVAKSIDRCGALRGVRIRHGSRVVEFMVLEANKGDAVRRAMHHCGATAVLFVGDDTTDEDVFRSLRHQDLGVKVGGADTLAHHRVTDIAGVAALLRELGRLRGAWAHTRDLVPLDRCGILSDQRTTAVVTPGARIEWLCLPRFDSPALFASLLSDDTAGYFDIQPADRSPLVSSSYAGDSMVLVTEWPGLWVTDYLDSSAGRAYQKARRTDLLRVIEGTVPARIRFAPRLDFGRISTQLRVREDGLEIDGSNDPIVLYSPGVRWGIRSEGVHQTAEAVVQPASGPIVLELRYGSASLKAFPEQERARREENLRFWSGWAASLKVPSVHAPLVRRSALILKALCYGPTGALTAAATTSVPELFGGGRNWDYRYCWPRDAAMAASALLRLGNVGHAIKFLDWMLDVVDCCESPDRLRPIYTVSGSHTPGEAELGHMQGFAQSLPVRIGNAAASQVQLDVFGPIVHLAAMLGERGAPITPNHWRLVQEMVRAVESRWREPDHGI